MIFVTVGTHEQQFNRLVKKIDELVEVGAIKDEVFIQTGYCDYIPKHCEWAKIIPYTEMIEKMKEAKVVITHGGPASFMQVLQLGKTPIVVPRVYEFNEHVNNHQVEFCKHVEEHLKNIYCVYDCEEILEIIDSKQNLIDAGNRSTNNSVFCKQLRKLIEIQ